MVKHFSDPRVIRLGVYGVALVIALIGILSGVWDVDTVSQWFGDDGVVAWVALGLISVLAGANINPKTPDTGGVEAANKTVDELADLRRRMAS